MARGPRLFGWLALIGLLLLTSPGVHLAHAGDGPSCQASGDSKAVEAQLKALQHRIDAEAPAAGRPGSVPTPDADGAIVLNNRGYNYTPPRRDSPRPRNGEALPR
jgi:hypothetical protein